MDVACRRESRREIVGREDPPISEENGRLDRTRSIPIETRWNGTKHDGDAGAEHPKGMRMTTGFDCMTSEMNVRALATHHGRSARIAQPLPLLEDNGSATNTVEDLTLDVFDSQCMHVNNC